MIIDRTPNNQPDIENLSPCQVWELSQPGNIIWAYLGALISNKWGCLHKINHRCKTARKTAKILSDITLNTEEVTTITLIFPVLLCGQETWPLKAIDRR